MSMIKKETLQSPVARVTLNVGGTPHNIQLRLPIFTNKFIEQAPLSADKFVTNWDGITHSQPNTFQKVDIILPNPAPPSVSHMEVLKKMAHFM